MSRFKWWRRLRGGVWYRWQHSDGRTLWMRQMSPWMPLGKTITVGEAYFRLTGDGSFYQSFTAIEVEDYRGSVKR